VNDQYRSQLEQNGADVQTTVKRFMGNEAMYERFLGKFLKDENYAKLIRELEQKNYEEAFKCAHTLKGVAANLGLTPIYTASSELTELLRDKKPEEVDVAAADAKKEEIEASYAVFSGIISANQQS